MKLNCEKYILSALMVLTIELFCTSCKREGIIPEVKPLLKTSLVNVNDGVTLSGEFILSGSYRSIQYGFHLDTNENFINSTNISVVSENKPVRFEITLSSLKPDVKYYVRSWAKTDKYEVLGNKIEFQSNGSSAPVIAKVVQEIALWGDTIMITGKYFDCFGKDNKVKFNEVLSTKTWGNQDTIWAIVPFVSGVQNNSLIVNVEVFNNQTKVGSPLKIGEPVISGISATDGQYPDTITVTGNNFSRLATKLLCNGL
jgi:hypothetical protein